MRISALVLSLGLMAAGGVYAQETQPFSFAVGGGYTNSLGSSGRYLDNGWNVQAGGGFNFNSHLGAMLDFNYNSLGINSATLGNLGAPGGGVHIMSFTIDPIVHAVETQPHLRNFASCTKCCARSRYARARASSWVWAAIFWIIFFTRSRAVNLNCAVKSASQ